MADACAHYGICPSLRQVSVNAAQSFQFSSPLQHSAFDRSDLTSYLQFCNFHDFTATMASDQDEVDMEAFQRLSDNYQPDVQVRSLTDYVYALAGLTSVGTSHLR